MNRRKGKQGYILIAAAIAAIVVVGMLGLSVDAGHMFITKSEAQGFADSAAIAAALQLDGSTQGIQDAISAVQASVNRWNFSTAPFTGTTIEFAQQGTGPWQTAPNPAAGFRFVRVTAASSVGLYFAPVLVRQASSVVRARAAAAQVPKTTFREAL